MKPVRRRRISRKPGSAVSRAFDRWFSWRSVAELIAIKRCHEANK